MPDMTGSNFGRRVAAGDVPGLAPHREPVAESNRPSSISERRPSLRIANSSLIVIRAIIEGVWGSLAVGEDGRARLIDYPWSAAVVEGLVQQNLDLAIYNSLHGRQALMELPGGENVCEVGVVGHSMGGRNFAILTSAGSKWADMSVAEFAREFEGGFVLVGGNSDRYANLLDVLSGAGVGDLSDRGVTLIESPDADLEMLQSLPESVMVAGQNRRYQATLTDDVVELAGYETIDPEVRERIRKRSANSLYAHRSVVPDDEAAAAMLRRVQMTFQQSWNDRFDRLASRIASVCDVGTVAEPERVNLVHRILFETYRIGEP